MLFLWTLLLLAEGLGFGNRDLLLWGALLIAIYTLSQLAWEKKPLKLPRTLGFLLGLFAFSLTFSQFFSQDFSRSLPLYLLTLGSLGLGLYSYRHQALIKKDLPKILMVTGVIFVLGSLGLRWAQTHGNLFFIPRQGENLVFSTYPRHNHLGDYLALVGAMFPLTLPLGLPLMVWSLSRTGFLSLGLVIIARLKHSLHKRWLILVLLILAAALVYAFSLKDFFNGRDNLWRTTWETFKLYPWFGIGLGNFMAANIRFSLMPYQWAATAENIFLNFLAETGLLTTLSLVALIIYVLIKAEKSSKFFFGFLCLLLLFQTDYLFSFYSLWLLFWMFLGLNIRPEKQEISLSPSYFLLPLTLLISFIIGLNLYYFALFLGQNELAHLVYPWNNEAKEAQIAEAIFEDKRPELAQLTEEYATSFPIDVAKQQDAAAIYLRLGKRERALGALEQALTWHPFEHGLYKQIYYLCKQLSGKKAARQKLLWYETHLLKAKDTWQTKKLRADFREFKVKERL